MILLDLSKGHFFLKKKEVIVLPVCVEQCHRPTLKLRGRVGDTIKESRLSPGIIKNASKILLYISNSFQWNFFNMRL